MFPDGRGRTRFSQLVSNSETASGSCFVRRNSRGGTRGERRGSRAHRRHAAAGRARDAPARCSAPRTAGRTRRQAPRQHCARREPSGSAATPQGNLRPPPGTSCLEKRDRGSPALAQIGGHQCRPNGLIPAVFPARRSYRCPDGAPAVIIGLSRERGEKPGEIEAETRCPLATRAQTNSGVALWRCLRWARDRICS
jgi:hypothetical protein